MTSKIVFWVPRILGIVSLLALLYYQSSFDMTFGVLFFDIIAFIPLLSLSLSSVGSVLRTVMFILGLFILGMWYFVYLLGAGLSSSNGEPRLTFFYLYLVTYLVALVWLLIGNRKKVTNDTKRVVS